MLSLKLEFNIAAHTFDSMSSAFHKNVTLVITTELSVAM